MKDRTIKLLKSNGYCCKDISECSDINFLARWTPLFCAILGTAGLLLQSPIYFLVLGMLNLIGAISYRSFYDIIYNISFRFIFQTGRTPKHNSQRRFGCALGSLIYFASSYGFYINNIYLAYLPVTFLIILALIAAVTHWCFAAALYNRLFANNSSTNRCCG